MNTKKLNPAQTILNFLNENLNTYSPIKLKVLSVTEQSNICHDPNNEKLFFALIEPEDTNLAYTDYEPLINTRRLSNHMQELDIANEDGVLTIESYIGLNSTILLPITILE